MKRIKRASVLFSHTNMSVDEIRRETGVGPAGLFLAAVFSAPAIVIGRIARRLSAG